MRTLFRITLACLLWVQATAAFAECTRPRPTFTIPEGGSASEQELAAANTALTDFGSKVRDYLNCMNGEMSQKAVGKDAAARDEINKAHAAAYNDSANELRGLAACYKTQREIFKSTGGGSKAKPADCSSYIASAASQVASGGGTPVTTELTIEASGHTFPIPAGGDWRYYLARDIRPRRCTAQEATEECLYRTVHVRNDSDEVLECKGEITYVGTDSRGQKTATGQLLVSGRGTYVLVESLAKQGVDAETFEAKCDVRAKLPALDTPAGCKYEVVKPISIADYYPTASRDAGEEGPVIVEFTVSGKAARPTDVRAVASSMYPRLDEAAVKAVGDMVMSSSCGKARFRLKLSFLLQQ
ncbi:MAG TPA: energy transducer TonB [Steroidobacteraceae bacterium]|nr:energy transducer TonB [Steroidobacteraceae bacterium]